jgi:hypothetical protein
MRTLLKVLGWLVLVAVLVVASRELYFGNTTWYFRVNGQVTVDGHKTTGYLHANVRRTALLVTRTDAVRPETYLVSLGDEKAILDCGRWHPTRFLPSPIGDINPPCFLSDPKEIADAAISATLKFEPRSVEFSTASGKKVKAEW